METLNLLGRKENPDLNSDAGGLHRILVVDDDPSIRHLLTVILMGAGYHVDAASDGGQAWDILQGHSYDLVITDNNMPNMTGLELLQKLDFEGCESSVIMAAAFTPRGKT